MKGEALWARPRSQNGLGLSSDGEQTRQTAMLWPDALADSLSQI
jgi:hypothetical protein